MVEIDTLFQTKTAKKTPFSTTHTYIAYIRDYLPPGAKNALQIMSLAAYASETNQWMRLSILWRIKEIEAEADNTLWDVHNSVYDTKADYYSFKIIPSLKT